MSERLFEIGKGLPDFIKWAFWVVAFLAVGALLFVSLTEHTTAIEPISVPKTLADQGYTSDIAACRLRDALNKFAAHALKRYKVPVLDPQLNTKIALDGEVPNIIVPTTGLSLNTISTSIRSFLGSGRRRSISGEFFLKNGLLRLRLRLDGNVLYDSPGADPESPDKLLALAAPRIFKALQPYILVSAEENPQKALEIANEIIARLPERDENVVWSYILKGDIQRKLGKYAEAVESLKKAIDLAPQLAVPHLFLGFVHSDRSDPDSADSAIAEYTEAMRVDSRAAVAYALRADAYSHKKDYNRAIADYTDAIRLNRKYAIAYVNRGNMYFAKKEYDSAIADFTKAIYLQPEFATAYAYSDRGDAYSEKAAFDLAVDDQTEAIRLNPKLAIAYNRRGNAYLSTGDLDYALADCTEAIRLDRSSARAYGDCGFVNYLRGNYAAAASDLAISVSQKPDYADAVLRLYLAQSRSGNENASAMLEVNADKLDKGVWPYPVVVLFLREKELTPEKTLEAAGDNVDHRCEAEFYIGEWRWLQGNRAGTIASLQAANKDCRKQLVESAGAEAELKRLSN